MSLKVIYAHNITLTYLKRHFWSNGYSINSEINPHHSICLIFFKGLPAGILEFDK